MSENLDKGANRDQRIMLCPKRAWCIENAGHDGPCIEVPREKQPTPNYGPRTK